MTTGERILGLLPATRTQLERALQVSSSTLHKWITRLHKEERIHIGKYDRTLGDFAAVWYVGKGKDARRPKKLSRAAVAARYRESLKKLGVYEDVLADQRKRWARKRAKPKTFKSDPLMAMLYKERKQT